MFRWTQSTTPTPAEHAASQLADAEVDLLDALLHQESIDAHVRALQQRVARLRKEAQK